MFTESQASLFGDIADPSTPSSADHPASPPALPGSEAEPLTIGGSGLSFCAWCVKSLPCGCWRRTLAESFLSMLRAWGFVNGLCFSLRISDTRSCRSFLLLQTSGQPTSESESGLWPTPTANYLNRKELKEKKRVDGLATAVKRWPSPRATDAEKGGPNQRGSKGDLMLPSAVAKWASPIAGDADGSRTSKGKDRPGECGLAGQVKKWATPQAFDAKDIQRSPEALQRAKTKGGCSNLREQVRQWSTPLAADWRSIRASEETLRLNFRPSREQVGQWAKGSTNGTGKSPESFHLNPRWELQLMGMPADWLDGVELE